MSYSASTPEAQAQKDRREEQEGEEKKKLKVLVSTIFGNEPSSEKKSKKKKKNCSVWASYRKGTRKGGGRRKANFQTRIFQSVFGAAL